jgi:small-conductance mechanosensitive channel
MNTFFSNLFSNYLAGTLFNPTTTSGTLFYALLIIIIAWIIGRMVHLSVRHHLQRARAAGIDSTATNFVGQLIYVVVYVIAFLCYAYLIPSLRSLGSAWLASVGIISVVVGLATQSTLSNLVAGCALILYRPFRVGDRLQVATPAGPQIGTVESIDLGYTRLSTSDGRRIVLPNSAITNQTSINFSRSNADVLAEIPLTVAPGGDVDAAREILLAAAKDVSLVAKTNGCFVTSLGAAGTVLTLSVMLVDPGDIAQIRSDILEKANKNLDKKSIKLG